MTKFTPPKPHRSHRLQRKDGHDDVHHMDKTELYNNSVITLGRNQANTTIY